MLRLARPVEPTTSRVIALIGIACLGLPTGLMNGRSSSAELYVLDARHDVTMQIADVEDLVQKGGDTLPLNPTNSGGIEGAAQIAKQAGGVVVAVEAQADGAIDAFVGSETTKLVGEELARVFGAAR
jgi:ABC-type sugar transport system substrate-binding protein